MTSIFFTPHLFQETEKKCEQLSKEAQAANRREQLALATLEEKEQELVRLLEELHSRAQLLQKVGSLSRYPTHSNY
jgi:uncharacterized membrane protein YgaE (UPF0421/DUF939 family)